MKYNLDSIKNIIFDLGGVILNIDPQRTVEQMQRLGIHNFDEIYSKLKQNEIFDKLEKGELDENEFVRIIREFSGMDLNHDEVIEGWNLLLLDYPPERIRLLERLNQSNRFRTFLLSNTNQIHKETYTRSLEEQFGYDGLESLFEKAYFSHQIKMRKPDPEIYEFVLKDSDLVPEETLFLDDSEINLKSAQKMGIQTVHINGEVSISELFHEV